MNAYFPLTLCTCQTIKFFSVFSFCGLFIIKIRERNIAEIKMGFHATLVNYIKWNWFSFDFM